jgi:transcriptional regulator with XRE-family HTH domain
MSMPEILFQETPGDRVKMLRKRAGLTQQELALQVDRTQGWVSQVERSKFDLDQVSIVNSLARALHAHPREILGEPGVEDGGHRGLESANELLRRLRRLDLPPNTDLHRPLPEVEKDSHKVAALRGAAEYTAMGSPTVALFEDLHAACADPSPKTREQAFRLLTFACKEAHSFGYGLNHPHLVEVATLRARWCAQQSDDPLLSALADYMAARDAWTTADWEDANLLVDRALYTVESSDAGRAARASMAGALHLRAAITAARTGNGDEAYARLDAAADAAHELDNQADPYLNCFSTGNVQIHRVAVAVELGDGAEAVRASRGLVIPKDLPRSRAAHHFLDTARGWVWVGETERGLAALERADRLAPQFVRNHPMARATVRSLLRAEKRSTRERLRSMATRVGVA